MNEEFAALREKAKRNGMKYQEFVSKFEILTNKWVNDGVVDAVYCDVDDNLMERYKRFRKQ